MYVYIYIHVCIFTLYIYIYTDTWWWRCSQQGLQMDEWTTKTLNNKKTSIKYIYYHLLLVFYVSINFSHYSSTIGVTLLFTCIAMSILFVLNRPTVLDRPKMSMGLELKWALLEMLGPWNLWRKTIQSNLVSGGKDALPGITAQTNTPKVWIPEIV